MQQVQEDCRIKIAHLTRRGYGTSTSASELRLLCKIRRVSRVHKKRANPYMKHQLINVISIKNNINCYKIITLIRVRVIGMYACFTSHGTYSLTTWAPEALVWDSKTVNYYYYYYLTNAFITHRGEGGRGGGKSVRGGGGVGSGGGGGGAYKYLESTHW